MNYLFLAILVVIFSSVFSFASGVIIFLIMRIELNREKLFAKGRLDRVVKNQMSNLRELHEVRGDNDNLHAHNKKLTEIIDSTNQKIAEIKEWIDSGGKPPKKPGIVTSMTGFREKSEQRYIDQMEKDNKKYPAVVRQ